MPTLRTAPTWLSQVLGSRGFIGRVEHVRVPRPAASLAPMKAVEAFGDATLGDEWASVHLWARGDLIVDAHAEGLDAPLV